MLEIRGCFIAGSATRAELPLITGSLRIPDFAVLDQGKLQRVKLLGEGKLMYCELQFCDLTEFHGTIDASSLWHCTGPWVIG